MLILITGLNGAGKSLKMLDLVTTEFVGRKVYYDGIPGLTLPWEKLPPEGWTAVPDGSVVVFDEAQSRFPARDGKVKVPDDLRAMETHRHRGIDIVFVTQHPRYLDVHVRRLIARHIHLARLFNSSRATAYEWDSCKEDVEDRRVLDLARTSIFKHPPELFSAYRSASLHTMKKRVPWQVYGVGALVGVFVLAGVALTVRLSGQATDPLGSRSASGEVANRPEVVKAAPLSNSFMSGVGPGSARTVALSPADRQAELALYLQQREPRLPDLPASASRYDELMAPRSAPVIAGCVENINQCICYSAQATRLMVSRLICRSVIEQGYFDDTIPPAREGVPAAPEGSRGGARETVPDVWTIPGYRAVPRPAAPEAAPS